MKTYPHILSEIARTPWAITPAALRGINKAARGGLDASDYPTFHGAQPADREAVSEMLGTKSEGKRLSSVRDGIGILQINGPIVPRGDAFTDMSGLTTIDRMSAELSALAIDPAVRHILLVIDSPGGAITGISEFASMVEASEKPTTAYVYGMAASAAYWIASAADEIIAGDTGMVGSIGVVMSLLKGDDDEVEIVSSQSPLKRPDPDTEEGMSELKREVDGLADVFVKTVAKNRSVSVSAVLKDFGRGGMVLPTEAVKVGMIDAQSTLSEYLGELISGGSRQKQIDNPPLAGGKERGEVRGDVDRASNLEEPKMNLTEFLKEHPEVAAEVAAIKEKAIEDGRAAATSEKNERNVFASKILASDSYPAYVKGIASDVLAGTKPHDHLVVAVDTFDAIKAEQVILGAQIDSASAPATPPQTMTPRSADGVLRTAAEIDAEAAAMKAGR